VKALRHFLDFGCSGPLTYYYLSFLLSFPLSRSSNEFADVDKIRILFDAEVYTYVGSNSTALNPIQRS